MTSSEGAPRPVFLMTDFGESDPYVGLMKAVLMEKSPAPEIVDLTHEIPPQDEANAAFLLEYVVPDLPEGSILLLVVDPEVGTDRNIVAVETERSVVVVAPDTGLTDNLSRRRSRRVTNEELARDRVSSTFHGRDWFAPVGRFLSHGGNFENLGPPARKTSGGSPLPEPIVRANCLEGRIVHVDHFGNLVTNLSVEQLEDHWSDWRNSIEVDLAGRTLRNVASTYAEAEGLTALVGSFERLELAVPGGSAAERLGVNTGTEVTVRAAPVAQDT